MWPFVRCARCGLEVCPSASVNVFFSHHQQQRGDERVVVCGGLGVSEG